MLFPAMLAGLLGLAGPIVFHLIARHRFPVQDFPAIRFLRQEKRVNVFAWRLVDPFQLLLRLLVLLLLVLAMCRLFVGCARTGAPPRNVVVVLDGSASMQAAAQAEDDQAQALFDLALLHAAHALQDVAPPSHSAVIVAGADTQVLSPLMPGSVDAIASLGSGKACDGTGGGLVQAIARACNMVRGRREIRSQIVVFTDARRSAFSARGLSDLQAIRSVREELGDSLDIAVIRLPGPAANLAITEAEIRGGEARLGDDAHVVAKLANRSAVEQATELRLTVAGKKQPHTKSVVLPPGEDAVVELTARVNRTFRTFAEIATKEHDAFPLDDSRVAPLTVTGARRVLIVDGSGDEAPSDAVGRLTRLGGGTPSDTAADQEETVTGATILRYVLNPGRELGQSYGTGIDPTVITPDALAGQPLSKYDVVFLYDVSSLAPDRLADLDAFVRHGRALVIVASASVNPLQFNRTLAASVGDMRALSPAAVGNDVEPDVPASIAISAVAHPVLAPFADRARGDLSVVRFSHLRRVDAVAESAQTMFSTGRGMPLAIEQARGHGRVVLLAFGFKLDRGNIARTRVFPVFAWRLVDYLTGRLESRPPDTFVAESAGVLDVSEASFAFAPQLQLERAPVGESREGVSHDAPIELPVSDDGTVTLGALPVGRYILRKDAGGSVDSAVLGYHRCVTVNPDPRESDLTGIGVSEIKTVLGPETRELTLAEMFALAPAGAELRTLFVVLLILAYCVEGATGWVLTARRERERSEGGT